VSEESTAGNDIASAHATAREVMASIRTNKYLWSDEYLSKIDPAWSLIAVTEYLQKLWGLLEDEPSTDNRYTEHDSGAITDKVKQLQCRLEAAAPVVIETLIENQFDRLDMPSLSRECEKLLEDLHRGPLGGATFLAHALGTYKERLDKTIERDIQLNERQKALGIQAPNTFPQCTIKQAVLLLEGHPTLGIKGIASEEFKWHSNTKKGEILGLLMGWSPITCKNEFGQAANYYKNGTTGQRMKDVEEVRRWLESLRGETE
jgi:hypothetical protein